MLHQQAELDGIKVEQDLQLAYSLVNNYVVVYILNLLVLDKCSKCDFLLLVGEARTHYINREKNLKIKKSDLRNLSVTIFPDEELSLLDDSVTVTETVPYSSFQG